MPVLLRLLLCLTLLANTASGAWAAQAMAPMATAPAKAAPCHMQDGIAADVAVTGHGGDIHAGHADPSTPPHGPGADHCASHGCNCLQHCAYSFALPGVAATWPPRPRAQLPQADDGRGLPQPYQPIRPPIA